MRRVVTACRSPLIPALCLKRVNTRNKNLAMEDPIGPSLLSWDCGVMVSELHPLPELCPLPSALPLQVLSLRPAS